jgi:hypothetical protein
VVSGARYTGGKAAAALGLHSTSPIYLCCRALRLKDNIMFKRFSIVYLKGFVNIKFWPILIKEDTCIAFLLTLQ